MGLVFVVLVCGFGAQGLGLGIAVSGSELQHAGFGLTLLGL